MRGALATFAVAAAVALAADGPMRRGAREFPPLSELPPTPFAMQDAALASAGFRAAAADLAWIQLLQYIAGSLPEPRDVPGRPYGHLKAMSLRVARLDPSFHRAYLYSASILGWFRGVDRPDEAAEILAEGMRRDPGQPLYPLYLAALAYKKQGNTARMIALLESSFDDPQTPTQMKTILANIYKAERDYSKALELWGRILDNEADASEHPRARLAISELRRLMREKKPAQRRQNR